MSARLRFASRQASYLLLGISPSPCFGSMSDIRQMSFDKYPLSPPKMLSFASKLALSHLRWGDKLLVFDACLIINAKRRFPGVIRKAPLLLCSL